MTAITLGCQCSTPIPFAAEFNGTPVSIVYHAGHKWLTAADVGRCLGYIAKEAANSINRLYARHADEFTDEDTYTVKLTVPPQQGSVNLTDPSKLGGDQTTRIFSATGCIKLGFFANTSLAKAFRAWASRVLAGHLAAAPAPASATAPRITRAIEFEVLTLFVAGLGQGAIAKQLGISRPAVNCMLHGRYPFSPHAGHDLTTPALRSAVAQRHVDADLERLTMKYLASARNVALEQALDSAGQYLLGLLPQRAA